MKYFSCNYIPGNGRSTPGFQDFLAMAVVLLIGSPLGAQTNSHLAPLFPQLSVLATIVWFTPTSDLQRIDASELSNLKK